MKRLKENQKYGCTWCKKEGRKVPAIWRERGFAGSWACEKHRPDLEKQEREDAVRESRMTEADYQTWGRL
uniref:Uncharacterized protein n=1 Tax=Pseudomonas phage HRDY3 TaxID=3236930 RepID=A0AB39CEM0_9VIRU